MYNRYIGNTGRYYRVEDDAPGPVPSTARRPAQAAPAQPPGHGSRGVQPRHPEAKPTVPKLSELTSGLKGLVDGLLPDGVELGDVVLILILLLLYLEKEDEEILVILSALVFMGFRP